MTCKLVFCSLPLLPKVDIVEPVNAGGRLPKEALMPFCPYVWSIILNLLLLLLLFVFVIAGWEWEPLGLGPTDVTDDADADPPRTEELIDASSTAVPTRISNVRLA